MLDAEPVSAGLITCAAGFTVASVRTGAASKVSSAGAFCCVVAGWLAAAAWSKSYWNRSMARQVALWRRIADTIFAWLEDAPLPAESLHTLKSSLEEVVPRTEAR